ncbi:MAG: L-histidine N(alpha)-methyltransferase [Rhizobiales bacterium]|nr:L-histidine N(alpha)-methyltransferase [Hyphomicrobiales bacterium]
MAAVAQTALRHVPDKVESDFAHDVVAGLSARPKRLSPKYFYDELGAQLFEEITQLPEYYPTRCELSILENNAAEMAQLVPPDAALIEFGSGSTRKARILLDAAPAITAYVPVDISSEMLQQEAAELRRDYPRLSVLPVEADFTKPFQLPDDIALRPRVGFFPGSTIGNFEPHAAAAFLSHAASMLGAQSTLIIGFDLVKDVHVLNAAYNDAAGVTARFNLNLLTRINRELGANFDLGAFCHQAFYNAERRRIEMHLASRTRQKVKITGRSFEFRAGETIHTESSYKYTPESFGAMARGSGWTPVASWTDPQRNFMVQALSRQG